MNFFNNKMDSQVKYQRPEGLSSSEDESEYDDYGEFQAEIDKKIEFRKTQQYVNRISVSAEVYGEFNKKEQFKPPVYNKTEDQQNQIRKKLLNCFMFKNLEDRELEIIIKAMKIIKLSSGEMVIKQGEDGNEMFIVEQGSIDCFKKFKDKDEETFLKTYQPGELFGELTLLYNAPRSASLKTKTDVILLSLDRKTFNIIVKDAVIQRRDEFEKFVSQIKLLDPLTGYERQKICDILKIEKFKKDEVVIKQGDIGDKFYFIRSGNCVALKDGVKVLDYQPHDYFGELSLLKDQPRAATIKTQNNVVLASLDRKAFKRILGPLEEILKRNMKRYETFVK